MKQETKKVTKAKKNKASKWLKVSYIGTGLALGVLFVVLTFTLRLSNITLPSENIAMPLPTVPPLATPKPTTPLATLSPVAPAPPARTAQPVSLETSETEALAVAAKPDTVSLILPAKGNLLKPFSADELYYSKTLGDWRSHNGIDIEADQVAEVLAAADGVIEQAFCDAQMGYTIIIRHNDTYQTVYQNLASCEMVKPGQTVTQGQCIAAVGNSAKAELLDESHLHFALLANGNFQNPMEFIIQ